MASEPSPVFIFCPADVVTGGPELLHQLADTLNGAGIPAKMVYYPFSAEHRTPPAYQRYNAPTGSHEEVGRGTRVVFPEVACELAMGFPDASIHYWWLSVDNYFNSWTGGRLRQLLAPFRSRRGLRWLRKNAHRHLYQSDYARLFLEGAKLQPALPLSDFLAQEYLGGQGAPLSAREDILVYNPAKGKAQTEQILAELERRGTAIRAVPLVNMQRDEVRDLLARAKIYIDFGHHPGKDRIPREAAALGACVIVNRRGSAANDSDIPLPAFFKIDDTKPGFEGEAADRAAAIMADFATYSGLVEDYRKRITGEPARFREEALRIFGPEA
jgi:hypothetical protein